MVLNSGEACAPGPEVQKSWEEQRWAAGSSEALPRKKALLYRGEDRNFNELPYMEKAQ